MLAYASRGVLLGAVLIGAAGCLESYGLVLGEAHERDFGLWRSAMPAYLGWGALLGLVATILLPGLSRRRDRQNHPGLHLALLILILGGASWLWLSADLGEPARSAWIAGGALLAYGAGYALAVGRLGWPFASFFSSAAASLGLILLLAAAWLGETLPIQCGPRAASPRETAWEGAPNVALVVWRGVGADHLGCYRHYRNTSRFLDGMAREGVLFERAFAASAEGDAALASLHTGSFAGLAPAGAEPTTLARWVTQQGWRSAAFVEGQSVRNEPAWTDGFGSFGHADSPPLRDRLSLFRALAELRASRGRPTPPPDPVASGLAWLAKRETTPAEGPFFLYLELSVLGEEDGLSYARLERFLPPEVPPQKAQALIESPQQRDALREAFPSWEAWERAWLHSARDAAVSALDERLSRLLNGLRDMDLLEDTLLVVTADAGECFHERGGDALAQGPYDCRLRVPLVLRYPKELPAGTTVEHLASLVDLLPTLAEFLDLAPPPSVAGRSLLPAVNDEAVRQEVFSVDPGKAVAALRTVSAKLVRTADGRECFTDSLQDPQERAFHAGAWHGSKTARAAELGRRLAEFLSSSDDAR